MNGGCYLIQKAQRSRLVNLKTGKTIRWAKQKAGETWGIGCTSIAASKNDDVIDLLTRSMKRGDGNDSSTTINAVSQCCLFYMTF